MNIRERVENIYNNTINTVKSNNEEVFKNGQELLENLKEGSQPWRALAEEAVAEGRKLVDAQKGIFNETSEALKGQYKEGANRFKAIFTLENAEKEA